MTRSRSAPGTAAAVWETPASVPVAARTGPAPMVAPAMTPRPVTVSIRVTRFISHLLLTALHVARRRSPATGVAPRFRRLCHHRGRSPANGLIRPAAQARLFVGQGPVGRPQHLD